MDWTQLGLCPFFLGQSPLISYFPGFLHPPMEELLAMRPRVMVKLKQHEFSDITKMASPGTGSPLDNILTEEEPRGDGGSHSLCLCVSGGFRRRCLTQSLASPKSRDWKRHL